MFAATSSMICQQKLRYPQDAATKSRRRIPTEAALGPLPRSQVRPQSNRMRMRPTQSKTNENIRIAQHVVSLARVGWHCTARRCLRGDAVAGSGTLEVFYFTHMCLLLFVVLASLSCAGGEYSSENLTHTCRPQMHFT